MVELSNERIGQILHEETPKTEEMATILRSIYTRYMHLYENFFADIDALNDDKITELKKYHEETGSLIKHYRMDIPHDICVAIKEFDTRYSDKLLGTGWHEYLSGLYEYFKNSSTVKNESEGYYKAEFAKHSLEAFYDAMDYIFRDDFGTGSQTAKNARSVFARLFFGK